MLSQLASQKDKFFTNFLKSALDVDHRNSNFTTRFIIELVFSKKQNLQKWQFWCGGCFRKTQCNIGGLLVIGDFTLSVVKRMGEEYLSNLSHANFASCLP